MSRADASGPALAALQRRVGSTPEDPFVFFRGERFHFRWWSYARAARELESAVPGADPAAPPEGNGARELLVALASAGAAEARLASELVARLGPGPERDVWISSRRLELAPERIAALAALADGWAVVREPCEPLPAETFAWARPTIVVGGGREVAALLAAFEALAPRPFRERWLRRRLARLRAVVIDDGEPGPAGERLAALGAEPRLLAFPEGS